VIDATCFKSVTITSAMHASSFLCALAGQVQAEQQAKLDTAVLAAQAAEVKAAEAAAQVKAAAQREAKLQSELAAAATEAAKAHAGLQHELDLARQETAQHKATAEREALLRFKAQQAHKTAAAKTHADQQRAPISAPQHGSAGEAGHATLSQSPPPGAALRVSGARSVECNGWYKQFGTFKGKPDYYKVGGYGTCLPSTPHSVRRAKRVFAGRQRGTI
jgi:membrane protein involved in colicin uptake